MDQQDEIRDASVKALPLPDFPHFSSQYFDSMPASKYVLSSCSGLMPLTARTFRSARSRSEEGDSPSIWAMRDSLPRSRDERPRETLGERAFGKAEEARREDDMVWLVCSTQFVEGRRWGSSLGARRRN